MENALRAVLFLLFVVRFFALRAKKRTTDKMGSTIRQNPNCESSSMKEQAMLYAGVARTDITPPLGIAHAGWGAQTHQRATGVDLPLWATALALSDGTQTVVIVDVDLIYIWDNEAPAVMHAVADLTGL